MSVQKLFPANLELRESTDDGKPVAALSHKPGGMFLLFVQEIAAMGEPRGTFTFVHDAGDHGGRYEQLALGLADAGWAVSLPDLRGHGRSEGDRGHCAGIEEIVRDLEDIQAHLAYMAPSAPRVLAGQGLGALWALASAIEKPEGIVGLVLANPLLEPRFELPKAKGGLRKLFSKVGPRSPGETGIRPELLTGDADAARAWSADELVHDKITIRAATEAAEAAKRYLPRLGSLGIPTLILQGGADTIGSPGGVSSLAGAELEIFDGLRHDIFHGSGSEDVISALERWLGKLVPRDSDPQ